MHAGFPLLRLALEQPQLLVEHASAYADLLASEGSEALELLEQRLLLRMLALLCLAVALMLAGVALMLGLSLPAAAGSVWLPWVPLPALLGSVAAGWAAHRLEPKPPFQGLREQVQIDFPAAPKSTPPVGTLQGQP